MPHDIALLEQHIARLTRSLEEREREIAVLKETAEAVSSELHLDKLLALIAEHAQRLIQAETVLVPVLDEACGQYTYVAGCGKNAEEIVGETLPLGLGVCGWVWRNKRAWWRGVLDELGPEERNQWEREAGSIILVPLIAKRHFLGGIAGINKLTGHDFDRRDLNLLSLFSTQAAIAIENARFFAQLDEARVQTENYQRQLESLNAELEQRVQARTAELQAANAELQRLALYDALTGLPGRRLIIDRLEQAMAVSMREHKPFSLIMMDLDRFKEVNDTLGHDAGDAFLRTAGAYMKALLRASDTVGRLGGDEFALILPGTDTEGAIWVARKIALGLEEATFHAGPHPINVGASLGIATYPTHAEDTAALVKCADVAMYAAKRQGHSFAVYEPDADGDKERNETPR